MGEAWKWTSANRRTTGGEGPSATTLQWGEGVEHTVVPWRGVLCTAGVIHCYDDPQLAVLMDPSHGRYSVDDSGVLWLCAWSGRTVTAADKRGVERLRTIRVVELPVLSTEQRVEIAIRASLVVLPVARRWAEGAGRGDVITHLAVVAAWAGQWLDGTDRSDASASSAAASSEAAEAAAMAASSAARAAAESGIPLDLVAICRRVAGAPRREDG